jgi:predicted PurR-regulated permease PerM
MIRPAQVSYAIMVLVFVLVAWLGLATPFITILFSYFALQKLSWRGSKGVGILLFTLLVAALAYASGYFFHQAMHALPKIAENSIPAITKFAKEHGLELPFTDLESLKAVALDTVMDEVRYVGKRATVAGKHAVMFVVGLVVAVSLFLNARLDLEDGSGADANLYSLTCAEVELRFRTFYRSFARVMGAQITISAINTALTAIFALWIRLPYSGLVVAVTFFCGMLPIIGNLISNTVIVCIAFTISPHTGIAALVFLVTLHKLEYFLNSKIIGGRIHNPMWLTLLALVVAERIMGVAGIILAPVILDYLKAETCRVEVPVRQGRPLGSDR